MRLMLKIRSLDFFKPDTSKLGLFLRRTGQKQQNEEARCYPPLPRFALLSAANLREVLALRFKREKKRAFAAPHQKQHAASLYGRRRPPFL